jgi:hypothetical protein
LIEPTTPFALVANLGDFPVYNNFTTEAAIKMTDKWFEGDKNYYLFYMNINRACQSWPRAGTPIALTWRLPQGNVFG